MVPLDGTIGFVSWMTATLGVEINPYVITREEFRRRFAAGDHFIREVAAGPKAFLKGGADELGAMDK